MNNTQLMKHLGRLYDEADPSKIDHYIQQLHEIEAHRIGELWKLVCDSRLREQNAGLPSPMSREVRLT